MGNSLASVADRSGSLLRDAAAAAAAREISGMALLATAAYRSLSDERKKRISSSLDAPVLYVLTHHRSAVVTVFGLPMSLLWNCALNLRSGYIRAFCSAPHLHDERVAAIRKQVLDRPDKTAPLCTARPGWMSVSLSYRNYKSKWNAIQMPLYDILETDTEQMIVRVEPFVSIGQLTHALNPRGYTLPVIPEMDDPTIGGLINGTSITSSLHKFGLFHEIVTKFELLLGDGTIVVSGEYRNKTKNNDDDDVPMFVEGLSYSLDSAVVMVGEFVDAEDVPRKLTNRLGLWWKPWFYKHVQGILDEKEETTEYIPLTDYYHRHTQSLFWEMELMIPIGNHPVFRWLLGWLMPPKVSFLKVSQTEMTRKLTEETHVAQDFLVPTRKMKDFLELCDDEYDKIYPLWLCLHDHSPMPGSILRDPAQPSERDGHEMYVDVGVYGLPRCVHEKREDEFDMKKSMRRVLKELVAMDGFQMLYADLFSTREEFEEMFDHGAYRELRTKYKADGGAFKEVYDKMHRLL